MTQQSETAAEPPADREPKKQRRDRTHWLYILVIVGVVAGVVVGLVAPHLGSSLGVLGTLFVNLIKMMISPVIFCTIVLGIGSVRKAASVGKVGGLAMAYFLVMSTIALAIGLLVGNLISPGTGLNIPHGSGAGAKLAEQAHSGGGTMEFFENIIPTTLLSSLTVGNVLQTLFVALLVGFGIQAMGPSGEPLVRGVRLIQTLIFRILSGILWLAPIGAFGAMAKVVGDTGFDAVCSWAC
jgi:Na+/H+-dicarboxylate symporters